MFSQKANNDQSRYLWIPIIVISSVVVTNYDFFAVFFFFVGVTVVYKEES